LNDRPDAAEERRLDVSLNDGLARLRLVRPDAANAIDLAFAIELEAAAETCRRGRARVVLITAEGRQFCGGGDLKSFAAQPDLAGHLREVTDHLHAGVAALVALDAPVIAAVQGPAAGAGLGLVGAADLVLAAESASFVVAYTRLGLSPDGSTSWFLPRLVGLRRALDLTLTNRVLDAAEALDWGLITRVVPDDELGQEAEALAKSLATGPTAAFGEAARLLRAASSRDLPTQLRAEADALVTRARGVDGREGVAAFAERRPPNFAGD
jgi:2-(1,2-epoxy-1,2-dihydrophenyl)acetyl-CoA isomerase